MNLFKKYPSITNASQKKVIDYIRMNLPEQTWIVSEKIHGANFQIIFDENNNISFASRNQLLDEFSSFYDLPGLKRVENNGKTLIQRVTELNDYLRSFYGPTLKVVNLFGEYGGYGKGEHSRDFISVEDIVKVNLFFLDNPDKSGIFNVGTGRSQPFNDLAAATVNACRVAANQSPLSLTELVAQKLIRYVDFPDALVGKYQSFTQADITQLRLAGYTDDFLTVEQGVERYVAWMLENLG